MSIIQNSLGTDDGAVLRREALIFGKYLIKKVPHGEAVELYVKALQYKKVAISDVDQARLCFVRQHPWAVRFVDPGLALVAPDSEIRRRIYVLFSILEAVPTYHHHFLPRNRRWWYICVIGFIGLWGLIKTIIGAALVRVIK